MMIAKMLHVYQRLNEPKKGSIINIQYPIIWTISMSLEQKLEVYKHISCYFLLFFKRHCRTDNTLKQRTSLKKKEEKASTTYMPFKILKII